MGLLMTNHGLRVETTRSPKVIVVDITGPRR